VRRTEEEKGRGGLVLIGAALVYMEKKDISG